MRCSIIWPAKKSPKPLRPEGHRDEASSACLPDPAGRLSVRRADLGAGMGSAGQGRAARHAGPARAGRAAGQAPCNRWFATVEGTLPAFRLSGIGATRMACPDLAAETAFLATLSRVTRAQVQEGMLVLEGPGAKCSNSCRKPLTCARMRRGAALWHWSSAVRVLGFPH
ncbi:META domain-containing protein [Gemmobacter lanyuensis]